MPRARSKKIPVKKTAKKTTSTTQILPGEYTQSLIAIGCILIAVISLIADTKSVFGFFLFNVLSKAFGEYYKMVFVPVLLVLAFFMLWKHKLRFNAYRIFGLLLFFVGFTTLIGFFSTNYGALFDISVFVKVYLGASAVFFIAACSFILSLVILFRFSPVRFTKHIAGGVTKAAIATTSLVGNRMQGEYEYEDDDYVEAPKTANKKTSVVSVKKNSKENSLERKKEELAQMLEELKLEKEKLTQAKQKKQLELSDMPKKITIEKRVPEKIKTFIDKQSGSSSSQEDISQSGDGDAAGGINAQKFNNWEFPSLDLLDKKGGEIQFDEAEIRQKELEIQEKLLQFNIDVTMEGYNVGPTVIQYRLKPNAGVKLQKIENLKKDLTLALKAKNLRIQAPIPGQGVVGIEAPNPNRQVVGLREVLESKEFNNPKIKIPLALGKNVNGEMIVGDLTKMPHLLVAGQTASGKSVGINAFLISILYRFSPSELKLILIDPKIVELSVYNGIPHLLTPVITNPSKALNSLKWCVAEMLRRYDLARQVGARNLDEYNAKVDTDKKLPYIVLVLDELADLMMSGDKKEVEGNITRIAQMARAVGMHVIIATQRPSVNIITGVIKANVPSRVAFTVSSQIDSQTILGKKGAEDLLGMGDMLYYPTGQLEPQRVQGVFVETHEVEAVVNKLKLTIDPDLLSNMQDDSIVNGKSTTEGSILENYRGDQDEDPEIIEKAMLVVKEAKKGSTSLVQRKLGLGYARAAKVLDILEELGVVGPANGSKPREVYVD